MKTHVHSTIWIRLCLIIVALGLLFLGYSRVSASEIKVPRITKEEVKSMFGNPDVIILDVRSAKDWADAVKGAGANGMRRNIPHSQSDSCKGSRYEAKRLD